ncbi:bleomycin resistance protein [Rhodobacteraceae bacterium F11138]|nr:bleomycin resistance protein [Rhodobacteraceae bacterium F11138]
MISANLPSRDFDATASFYARLGFVLSFRNDGWMILARGPDQVEFFPHPGLDPHTSWFSACLRVADIDALHRDWAGLGLSTEQQDIPRLTAPVTMPGAPRMFALVDPDGSLWRVLETQGAA